MHRAEQSERTHTTLTTSESTQRFHDQVHQERQNGMQNRNGDSSGNGSAAFALPHLDICNGVNQVEHAVAQGAAQAADATGKALKNGWDDLDKNQATHWFKHDLCNDDPTKAVIVGGIALAIASPAIFGASAVTGGAAIVGLMGAEGMKMDYDNRHPAKH